MNKKKNRKDQRSEKLFGISRDQLQIVTGSGGVIIMEPRGIVLDGGVIIMKPVD
jgi:hypothetical protein